MKRSSRRPIKHNGLKGIHMLSYLDQESKKQKMVWRPGLQGVRQQLRYLRNATRHILDSKDPNVIKAGDRVIQACENEPNPEYGILHLYYAAVEACRDTGEPWDVCMNYFMDKFDAKQEEEKQDAPPAPRDTGGSRLSGLLRALVTRPFRQSYESRATTDTHQQSGSVDGERPSSEEHDSEGSAGAGAGAPEENHT